MKIIHRTLKIDLPMRQSAFLWGPRKTGKSTFLKDSFPDSIYLDFLQTDQVLDFMKRPALLREQLLATNPAMLRQPVILDEVQKIPQLLDEVHWLIENKGLRFILCGSSARKLKRGKANLLGGRAWRYEMYPLTWAECDPFDLVRALNHGLIPDHYLRDEYRKSIEGYIRDYLKEEILAEGLTRNMPAFARFLDAVGHSHGELINYANIARDCGVDAKTVKEYYQILSDTLLGRMVEPFHKRKSRQVITAAAKFYLFDVGVAGALIRRRVSEDRGEVFGKAFEHFIFMELAAHASYRELNYDIHFWRTKTGLEVDFILGDGEAAIEVKGGNRIDSKDLKPMRAFMEEHHPAKAIVVCNEKKERLADNIHIIPWRRFLEALWEGKIIS